MKINHKIPLSLLRDRLQRQMNYRQPDIAFRTLLYCWIRHPRFPSPQRQTMNQRNMYGGGWLSPGEIASFESYIGGCQLS